MNGFDNPMRDPKTEEVKKQVGLVSIENHFFFFFTKLYNRQCTRVGRDANSVCYFNGIDRIPTNIYNYLKNYD